VAWGGHVFSPLRFNADGSAQELDCSPGATFQVSHAVEVTSRPTGKALAAADASPHTANVSLNLQTKPFKNTVLISDE
jgi:hypothetical protein